MAKVIIGGQALSLLLTLLVTPVAYSLWEDFTSFWTNHDSQEAPVAPVPAERPSEVNAPMEPVVSEEAESGSVLD